MRQRTVVALAALLAIPCAVAEASTSGSVEVPAGEASAGGPGAKAGRAPRVTGIRADPATLERVFDRAKPGATIALAPGDYGTFRGGMKAGTVTLKAERRGTASMRLDFDPARNIVIDGITLTGAVLADRRTREITVRNSDVPGQVTFRTGELADAAITFARNVHRDWDKCSGCAEGRVWLPESTSRPSGITIRDSEFRGGVSDGIQNGSNGTRIIGNTFHDLEPGGSDVHTDAIQLYGSRNTVIRGNFFYSVPDAIMAPDGARGELIEDNVIRGDPNGYPYAVTLWSDEGSRIRHNTFADGDCAFNQRCGIVSIGSKSGAPPGRGTVIADNILSMVAVGGGSATVARRSHNLLAHQRPRGPGEIRGRPTYVGGSSPTTYDGFRLARGSRGRGNAGDGLNRGARIGDEACGRARAKLKRARSRVQRWKRRVRRADGRRAKRGARKKLRRARRAAQRARRTKRHLC